MLEISAFSQHKIKNPKLSAGPDTYISEATFRSLSLNFKRADMFLSILDLFT